MKLRLKREKVTRYKAHDGQILPFNKSGWSCYIDGIRWSAFQTNPVLALLRAFRNRRYIQKLPFP